MSATRACRPCRTAKIRCDLQRPVCGACRRRNVDCVGLSESSYIFRDQNESARAASARARRGQASSTQPVELVTVASSEADSAQDTDETALTSKAMPWLKQPAPTSITFSLEDKARQIFYSEWILHPSNYGVSPGYLDIVPVFEAQASDSAVLHLAVDAFAMANIQNVTISGGTSLKDLASRKYGRALAALRRAIAEGQQETSDHILLAILVIDLFEIFFTNREEQLGAHSGAVEHIMTARRQQNVASFNGFSVYRIAHHRLQSRQLLLGLDPLPVQLDCIDMLNENDASVALVKTFLKELQVIRHVQEVVSSDTNTIPNVESQLSALVQRIRAMLEELDAWPERIPKTWHPRYLQVAEHEQLQNFLRDASLPLIRQVRLYHDPWIAYQLNFFYQGQIALRSAFINLLIWTIANVPAASAQSEALREGVEEQSSAVTGFADALVESTPPLIGSPELENWEPEFCHGKKIGRWFAREACWTLRNAQHVPSRHRDFADKAISWMQKLESQI